MGRLKTRYRSKILENSIREDVKRHVTPLFSDIFSIFVRSFPAAHKCAVLTPSSLHSLQEPSLKDLSTFALCDDSLPFPLESIPIRLFGPGSPPH